MSSLSLLLALILGFSIPIVILSLVTWVPFLIEKRQAARETQQAARETQQEARAEATIARTNEIIARQQEQGAARQPHWTDALDLYEPQNNVYLEAERRRFREEALRRFNAEEERGRALGRLRAAHEADYIREQQEREREHALERAYRSVDRQAELRYGAYPYLTRDVSMLTKKSTVEKPVIKKIVKKTRDETWWKDVNTIAKLPEEERDKRLAEKKAAKKEETAHEE